MLPADSKILEQLAEKTATSARKKALQATMVIYPDTTKCRDGFYYDN